jgi:hypothetical protein
MAPGGAAHQLSLAKTHEPLFESGKRHFSCTLKARSRSVAAPLANSSRPDNGGSGVQLVRHVSAACRDARKPSRSRAHCGRSRSARIRPSRSAASRSARRQSAVAAPGLGDQGSESFDPARPAYPGVAVRPFQAIEPVIPSACHDSLLRAQLFGRDFECCVWP